MFEFFSNNVVIRFFMQEYLFFIFVFIVGLGEVVYWVEFEKVFFLFSFKMFFVVFRLFYVIVERYIEKYMDEFQLDFLNVVNEGVDVEREYWFKIEVYNLYEMYFEKVKEDFEKIYKIFCENI